MKAVKFICIAIAFFTFSCSKTSNSSPKSRLMSGKCYTGKLVKKGICGNFVIEVENATAGELAFAPTWHDPSTGITHKNVFKVANPCQFPTTINQGETLTFSITNEPEPPCVVCEAYTPTPAEKNPISIGCDQGQQ